MSVILLVEDDTADARLLQRAFAKTQVNVSLSHVTNGDDAVAYLSGSGTFSDRSAHPIPDVVLLDIKLPRRSGLEILEWMRAQEATLRRIPVVIFSSSRHASDINRAYQLGANSYLSKPETFNDLMALTNLFRQYWLEWNQGPREAKA